MHTYRMEKITRTDKVYVSVSLCIFVNNVTNLYEFEEGKCWRTVGSKKCSNNWIDLRNK